MFYFSSDNDQLLHREPGSGRHPDHPQLYLGPLAGQRDAVLGAGRVLLCLQLFLSRLVHFCVGKLMVGRFIGKLMVRRYVGTLMVWKYIGKLMIDRSVGRLMVGRSVGKLMVGRSICKLIAVNRQDSIY